MAFENHSMRYQEDKEAHRVDTGWFLSQGTRCAFTLRIPSGEGPFPAVLMMHGWGGVQRNWVPPFYASFLQLGFAVMTFDYRGWGASEGLPRHVIRIADRLNDAEAALNYLKNQAAVDSGRIVLWGTSLGGGFACTLAARHPELMGAIAQVPMLDGRASSKSTPMGEKVRLGLRAVVDLFRGSRPLYVPIYAPPGGLGTMTRDNAYQRKLECERLYGQGANNVIAARSILTMGAYRPLDCLPQIDVPMIIVGGRRDTISPFDEVSVRAKVKENIEVEVLDANHFDPYLPPVLDRNLASQVKFLQRLLRPPSPGL